jgi:uncharacterized protein (TIGR02646 family)
MILFKRGANPLTTDEETELGQWWSEEYIKTKSTKNWTWKGKEKIIKEALLLCNNDHCTYCDCHPLLDDRGFEIDHFKPKTKFPLEAFTYFNLFPSCRECNKRMNKYHPLLLKPDEVNYQFKEYFRFDIFTGKILINESKSIENQERARITLDFFRLNIGNKPINRKKAIQKEIKVNSPINERPYRYGYL